MVSQVTCFDNLDMIVAVSLTAFVIFLLCMILARYLMRQMERERMNILP